MHPLLLPLLLLLLAGCGLLQRAPGLQPGTRPPVNAEDGASAALTLIMCADGGVDALREVLQLLESQGDLVVARSGGSARLSIEACAPGGPAPQPPPRR